MSLWPDRMRDPSIPVPRGTWQGSSVRTPRPDVGALNVYRAVQSTDRQRCERVAPFYVPSVLPGLYPTLCQRWIGTESAPNHEGAARV